MEHGMERLKGVYMYILGLGVCVALTETWTWLRSRCKSIFCTLAGAYSLRNSKLRIYRAWSSGVKVRVGVYFVTKTYLLILMVYQLFQVFLYLYLQINTHMSLSNFKMCFRRCMPVGSPANFSCKASSACSRVRGNPFSRTICKPSKHVLGPQSQAGARRRKPMLYLRAMIFIST